MIVRYGCAIFAPDSLFPEVELVQKARDLANKNDAHLNITTDISEPVNSVDYIHTDGWISMGEPTEVGDERINHLKVYRVNVKMIEMCGNPKCCAVKIHSSFQYSCAIL
jgi:ornithine carbamoyltransferase